MVLVYEEVIVHVSVGVPVLVNVGVNVIEGPMVGVIVDVRVGVGTQKIPVYTEFENDGGGASSESIPAVLVIVWAHAPVTLPHHDTACTPPHVLPTVQLTTFTGFEQDVPPPQPM
jgi:hypothetical protein